MRWLLVRLMFRQAQRKCKRLKIYNNDHPNNIQTTKSDIVKLILDILPEILDEQKKENKVRNLIYAMSKKRQNDCK